jgi:hypothetical protein
METLFKLAEKAGLPAGLTFLFLLLCGFVYLGVRWLRDYLLNWVQKREDHEITKKVEAMKADFAVSLEEKKADLGKLSAQFQHELQRRVMRAELQIRSLHKIYPILARKLHEAVGRFLEATASGEVGAPDYDGMTTRELLKVLDSFELSAVDRAHVLSQIEDPDRRDACATLDKYRRTKRLNNANAARNSAAMYVDNRRLYLSDDLASMCDRINVVLVEMHVITNMWIWRGLQDMPSGFDKLLKNRAIATEQIKAIDKQMRKELGLEEVGAPRS